MDFAKFMDSLGAYGDRSFPDAAFIVEHGAEKDKSGKTLQKYRHLPHHSKGAKSATENTTIDEPHLRNALARVNQVNAVKENVASFRSRAKSHLQAHARAVLKTYKSKSSLTIDQQQFMDFCISLGIKEEEGEE